MTQQDIFAVARQLTREGKKPTVALVKSRLSKPVPMRELLEALKVWRHSPETIVETEDGTNDQQAPQPSSHDTATTEQLIAAAIAPLQDEIMTLRAEINALKKIIHEG